jgi:alpha-galactosidase
MGWNSWNRYGGSVTESVIEQTADAMVASGMKDVGYQYINIDDTWQAMSRDACGNISADSTRFPSGIKALADYVHQRGLKLGIYSDRGTSTCGGRPGSFGHEVQDAQAYASWGVDYLKYDNCYVPPGHDSNLGMQQDYTKMRDALRATGRPVVFSICAWYFQSWMPSVGNLWRTTTDIKDSWSDNMLVLVDANGGTTSRYTDGVYGPPGIGQYAGPGHWNDPDMLEIGNGGMTDVEYRSHFSLWAMMAAPLIAGNDLVNMSAATKSTLTNAEVIAVDQDPLGQQGHPLTSSSTTLEVWVKPLSGTQTYAVLLLNRTAAMADISVTWSSLGITSTSAAVHDLWVPSDSGVIANGYTAHVASHGVVMLKVIGQ